MGRDASAGYNLPCGLSRRRRRRGGVRGGRARRRRRRPLAKGMAGRRGGCARVSSVFFTGRCVTEDGSAACQRKPEVFEEIHHALLQTVGRPADFLFSFNFLLMLCLFIHSFSSNRSFHFINVYYSQSISWSLLKLKALMLNFYQ